MNIDPAKVAIAMIASVTIMVVAGLIALALMPPAACG